MTETPFIAIEGPIGVGKTSLARKISAHFDFYLLREIVEENPFLGKFYEDIEAWSFQTEMFFLCNRFKQLEDIEKDCLHNGRPVVADYHIAKNMIFARRTLPTDKFTKYEAIFHILTDDLPKPNMMIYLSAGLDTIKKRIRQRDRLVEHHITDTYLEQLHADYEAFMDRFQQQHPEIPIIRIDGDELDFVKHQNDLDTIIRDVQNNIDKNSAANRES